MTRLRRAAPVLGALTALLGIAGPAHADPFGPWEVRSMATVTRLTLDHEPGQLRQGWLTIRVQLYSTAWTGFEVEIPAGDGQWAAAPVVEVPELGVVCREQTGLDLHYRCGQTEGPATGTSLPVGGYQVSFFVQHTGDPVGLTGTASLDGIVARDDQFEEYLGAWSTDAFPVHDVPHPRSSAEVAMAPVTPDPAAAYGGTATLAATVTAVPGETVTALDVALPRDTWHITGSNAARLGLQCFVRTDGPSLHCRAAVGGARFPAGRYGLTVQLTYAATLEERIPSYGPPGTLALTVDGDPAAGYDDFPWAVPVRY